MFTVVLRICFTQRKNEKETSLPRIMAHWEIACAGGREARLCLSVGVNLFIHLQNKTYLICSKGIGGSKGQRRSKTRMDVQIKISSVPP